MSLRRAEEQIATIRTGANINVTLDSAGENVIENLLYVQEKDVSDLIVEFLHIIDPHTVGASGAPLIQRVMYHPQAERFLTILLDRGAQPDEFAFCTAISQRQISEDFILNHFAVDLYPHTHTDVVNQAYLTCRKRLLRRVLDLGYPVSIMCLTNLLPPNADMEAFALEILQKDNEFDWQNVGHILRMMSFNRYTEAASYMFTRMPSQLEDEAFLRKALQV